MGKLTLRGLIKELTAKGEERGLMDMPVVGIANRQENDLNGTTTYCIQVTTEEKYNTDYSIGVRKCDIMLV